MPGPNESSIVSEEQFEGVIGEQSPLSLDMSEEEITRAIGKRIDTAKEFWNKEYNLDAVRTRNQSFWNGSYFEGTKNALHKHQTPYQENRVFINIESLVPMVLSRPPQPVVTAANDSEASIQLADDLSDVLLSFYDDQYLRRDYMTIARHLIGGQRIAFHKYRWDDTIGRMIDDTETGEQSREGNIIIDVVHPSSVVVAEKADNPDDVPIIGEYMDMSVEEMGYKFPKKKDELWKTLGISRGVSTQMHQILNYVEIWFSYFDKSGGNKEGLAWKYKNVLLGSMKNPHWNYDETTTDEEGNIVATNFFDKPRKPYVVYNHLSSGKYIVDETSLTEQAVQQQESLDKRGRQIIDNADKAESGIVYDDTKVKEETIEQLIGHPDEKIGVTGSTAGAVDRLPINLLPGYVLQDKQDMRDAIDNTFGAHAPIRGENANSPTLGQEVLSQRSDLTRIQTLATAIEDGADRLYKGIAQMMKVFYDEERIIRTTGASGKTNFIKFSGQMVEDGVSVRVKTGSVLPDDPTSKANVAMKLAGALDPLTLAEDLGKENAKEVAKRMMYYRMAPDKYLSEMLQSDPMSDGADPSAMQEQEMIVQGQQVEPQQKPTKAHLATHQAFIDSPQFKQLPPEIQQAMIGHVEAETENAKRSLHQKPEEQELEAEEEVSFKRVETEQPANAAGQDQSVFARIMNRLKGGDQQ